MVPIRYQTTTDKESFEAFRECYQEQVKQLITAKCDLLRPHIERRPDSVDKERGFLYLTEMPNKFPSLDWYIEQKPAEVKLKCDLTTRLCEACEGAWG